MGSTGSKNDVWRSDALERIYALAMRGFTETSPLRYTTNFLHNLSAEEIISIVEESVKVEQIWVRNSALPNKLVGMNQDLMCQYVKFVADLCCTIYRSRHITK